MAGSVPKHTTEVTACYKSCTANSCPQLPTVLAPAHQLYGYKGCRNYQFSNWYAGASYVRPVAGNYLWRSRSHGQIPGTRNSHRWAVHRSGHFLVGIVFIFGRLRLWFFQ